MRILAPLVVLSLQVLPVTAPAVSGAATCAASDVKLCLGNRFEVTATWQADVASGTAKVEPLTSDTGYLWFFDSTNVEAVVKVLDGCGLNGRHWVFAAGLTDVEVRLKVADTTSGKSKEYLNPPHTTFQPIQDTDAFDACAPPGDDPPGDDPPGNDPPGDEPPVARFAASCELLRCTVSQSSTDDVGIVHYLWDWGDGTPVETIDSEPWLERIHDYAESGRFTITHTVEDTGGQTGWTQREVVPNTPPVATDDEETTMRDLPIVIDVLANDFDADGDALAFTTITGERPGTLIETLSTPSGPVLRVTPPDSFVGVLTFDYLLSDDLGGQDWGTVSLTVLQYGSP